MGQPVVSEPRKELVGGGTNEKYAKGKLKLPCAPPVLATGGMHHHMLSRNALGLCTLLRPAHDCVFCCNKSCHAAGLQHAVCAWVCTLLPYAHNQAALHLTAPTIACMHQEGHRCTATGLANTAPKPCHSPACCNLKQPGTLTCLHPLLFIMH